LSFSTWGLIFKNFWKLLVRREIKQTENNQHVNALPLHLINSGFYDWIYSKSHHKCKRPSKQECRWGEPSIPLNTQLSTSSLLNIRTTKLTIYIHITMNGQRTLSIHRIWLKIPPHVSIHTWMYLMLLMFNAVYTYNDKHEVKRNYDNQTQTTTGKFFSFFSFTFLFFLHAQHKKIYCIE